MNNNQLKSFTTIQIAYQISQECGVPIYLVGGAVRDGMMGFFYGKDFDFAVGQNWEAVTRLFAEKTRGKVISWDFNQKRVIVRSGADTITVDFAKYRGTDIGEDLLERDFTINSMAVAVDELFLKQKPKLLDPLDGKKHLAEKIVKADSPSVFDQDPIRILRAIRFATAFNFSIENKTKSLLKKKAALLSMVAAERIKRELFSMLDLDNALTAVQSLVRFGIIQQVIPELRLGSLKKEGRHCQYGLLQNSLKTMAFLAGMLAMPEKHFKGYGSLLSDYFKQYIEEGIITRRALLVCAGLLYAGGKLVPLTAKGKTVARSSQEHVGVVLNQEMSRRLRLGKKARRVLETITRNYLRILQLAADDNITDRARIRLLQDIKGAPLEMMLFALADTCAAGRGKGSQRAHERVKQLINLLLERYCAADQATTANILITGNDIIRIMGIPEGRAIGNILREVQEGERAGIFKNRQEIIAWLKKKKRSKSDY